MGEKRFKRGDTREDGKLFWQYRSRKNGKQPWFVTSEKFEELKSSERERARQRCIEKPEQVRETRRRYRQRYRDAHPARVKMSPEEAAERRRESSRRYYYKNRERVLAKRAARSSATGPRD